MTRLKSKIVRLKISDRKMKTIILHPSRQAEPLPGILWIHGGGYMLGMAEMVYASCGKMLAEKYGAVVVSPAYRLAWKEPYPAAVKDCYAALRFMYTHADELGIRKDKMIVGGESAGGGLAAAVCLYARDKGEIPVYMQLPLYPMLDCDDTDSSRNNHGKVWNTNKNHWGWKHYLGKRYGSAKVSKYASPAKEINYANLPPCYTFVCDGEPFYDETLAYVRHLKAAGVPASVDIYRGNVHAFDMLRPWRKEAKEAKRKLCEAYKERVFDMEYFDIVDENGEPTGETVSRDRFCVPTLGLQVLREYLGKR